MVDKKWLATISLMIHSEMQQVTQQLTSEVVTVAERYERRLDDIDKELRDCEYKVADHLKEMGFEFNYINND